MRFFCFVFLFSIYAFGQTQYPKDYFRSPLDIPLQLSGNFGELRPNHIHAGFDFKTQQKEGLFVYASADGYVSRIKISEVGYGKAIYITHPNGYTTVYGHLQSGYGEIEKTIKKEQYKAFGRFVRERFDDFTWENDKVAHRTYGKALETWKGEPLTSSTIDDGAVFDAILGTDRLDDANRLDRTG